MARNNQITGNVGMFYACYHLSRIGFNVMPTSRNAKGSDIVAYTADQKHFLTFQVKTQSKLSNIDLGKTLDADRSDWWIVVIDAYESPTAFILTPDEIRRSVKVYAGSHWAQGSRFASESTRNSWDRILRDLNGVTANNNLLANSDAKLAAEFFRTKSDKTNRSLQVRKITWNGVCNPISRWQTIKRFELDVTPDEIAAATLDELDNPRFFRICSECGERKPVGYMSAEYCQGCGEKNHGLVH